ncbi:unnamed protein product [Cochlearia groenlandica]
MDQPPQNSSASQPPETPPQATATSASKPSVLSQISKPPSTNPSSSSVSSIPTSPATPSPSLNPNPNPAQYARPVTPSATQHHQHISQSLGRPPPPVYTRPWQQHAPYSHFSSASSPLISSSSAPSSSSSASSSLAITGQQRGGMAIGIPASPIPISSPSPSQPSPSAFPGSFGHQYSGGLGRGTVGMSEATSNTSVPQVRMMQGTQGIGMMGTLGSGSPMRPGGMAQHQQRPAQSSLRPVSSPSSQSPVPQNFQGHSLMRPSPIGSPGVQSTSAPQQNLQAINQPWLSSSTQGKPPLPPPSYRPQVNSPSMQQRSHIPQQHHSTSAVTSQPQQQQQHQPQEQLQPLRSSQQPLPHPHQPTRVQGTVNQKAASLAMPNQPPVPQPGNQAKTISAENEESGDRILGKRSIHELLQQIDPSEKLDPEVEDILADIAEDFVESITTFGCSLAKHRKSDTLEAKDILLHVERNWNIKPPGFSSDEIKTFRKPLTTDIHKERLAVIKKSAMATEAANARNPFGHGTARGGQAKTPANPLATTTFNH